MDRLNELSIKALDKWGPDTQVIKAVTELNELSLALLQSREGKVTEDEVLTEIADAEINKKLTKLEGILNK